jgi:hypothetical protein
MKTNFLASLICSAAAVVAMAGETQPPQTHPDTTGWQNPFGDDLSDAIFEKGVWSITDGELSATKDQAIFSKKQYERFAFDFEFKLSAHGNSGAIVYCSDVKNWIPHAVEVQLADCFGQKPTNGNCGAIYGHEAARKQMVKKPGEWNRMTVTCLGKMVYVVFNGELVAEMDLSKSTSAKKNPDGSNIPAWLSTPFAELPTKGHVGFQGLHGKSPVYFRNMKIKEL